jgi:hypothetical protein
MAIEREAKLYECEVERRRLMAGGGYEPYWKVKFVSDAVADEDSKFRCKDCGGAVKLFKSHKVGGPGPHVEHTQREDSEYCVSGMHYKRATDGREAKLSESPVV